MHVKAKRLTKRDLEVIELVSKGFKNADIAKILGLATSSIKNKIVEIFNRTGMWNRVELAIWWECQKLKGLSNESIVAD